MTMMMMMGGNLYTSTGMGDWGPAHIEREREREPSPSDRRWERTNEWTGLDGNEIELTFARQGDRPMDVYCYFQAQGRDTWDSSLFLCVCEKRNRWLFSCFLLNYHSIIWSFEERKKNK